jgi:hypothetical protein
MAKDKSKIEIDTKAFNQMLKHLSKITGASMDKVIGSQARMILEKGARGTKQAKVGNIVKRNMPINKRFPGGIGEKKFYTRNGKTFNLLFRVPEEDWQAILSRSTEKTKNKIAFRGLGKGQFSFIADMLKLKIKNTKPASKSSIQSFLRNRNLASGKKDKSKRNLVYIMRSSVEKGNFNSSHWAIGNAIASRTKHFKYALRKGVFADVKEVKKQFGL